MIGFYDYTVWLTYLSFISACTGIYLTLAYSLPMYGIVCLLISGLCDAFDGKVAATKKDRTEIGKKFGTKLSNKASILGGVILIAIGLEIFITGIL